MPVNREDDIRLTMDDEGFLTKVELMEQLQYPPDLGIHVGEFTVIGVGDERPVLRGRVVRRVGIIVMEPEEPLLTGMSLDPGHSGWPVGSGDRPFGRHGVGLAVVDQEHPLLGLAGKSGDGVFDGCWFGSIAGGRVVWHADRPEPGDRCAGGCRLLG